jgi:hypothetical protein
MNKQQFRKLQHENGLATLAVVLILLFVATLVTLYTANTVVREQQVSANQYRADQALSAANAALDYALAYYFKYSGPDAVINNTLDFSRDGLIDPLTLPTLSGDGQLVFADDEDLNIVSASCILYAYNANGDGVLDPEEKFGFRWGGGADDPIEMGTTVTSCDSDTGWEPLTDTDVITITDLSFDSVNSKCLNIAHEDNELIPGNRNNFWVTTKGETTKFPCMDATAGNLTNYIIKIDGSYGEGTFVLPNTLDRLIEVRQVNVVLQGELKNDDTMVKSQSVAINVRNNRVCKYSVTSPHCIDPTL